MDLSDEEIEEIVANCNLDPRIITKKRGLSSKDSDDNFKGEKKLRKRKKKKKSSSDSDSDSDREKKMKENLK